MIQLDDEYYLSGNGLSWCILKKNTRTRDGKQVTEHESIKWYTSLESLVKGFADLKIRLDAQEAKSFAELLKLKKNFIASVCECVQGRKSV